jgi:hypothetical protein
MPEPRLKLPKSAERCRAHDGARQNHGEDATRKTNDIENRKEMMNDKLYATRLRNVVADFDFRNEVFPVFRGKFAPGAVDRAD